MNILRIIAMSILITSLYTNISYSKNISIDNIEENQWISGFVDGLDAGSRKDYKVVVYVHTDQWYIHPYAGQGENYSWAVIKEDNTWKISTVRRMFQSNQIAALLVKRDYPEPDKLPDVRIIPHEAIVILSLEGTVYYRRL